MSKKLLLLMLLLTIPAMALAESPAYDLVAAGNRQVPTRPRYRIIRLPNQGNIPMTTSNLMRMSNPAGFNLDPNRY